MVRNINVISCRVPITLCLDGPHVSGCIWHLLWHLRVVADSGGCRRANCEAPERAEVPTETFAVAHPSGCRRHLPFTRSWVTTGLHRDLRPPLTSSCGCQVFFVDGLWSIFCSLPIWYRGNVLSGTKAVYRCILYRLKRFLVHGIVTRDQKMVINGVGKSW